MTIPEQDLVRRSRRFYLCSSPAEPDAVLVNLQVIMTEWHPRFQQKASYMHHSEWVGAGEVTTRANELLDLVAELNADLARQHALF